MITGLALSSSLRIRAGGLSAFLLLFLIGTLFAPTAAWTQNEPLFRLTENPGPYAVGLKIVEQYDRSRTFGDVLDNLGKPYQGERSRPLQTLIWYPAQSSKDKPMTVSDFLDLLRTQFNFEHPKWPVKARELSSALGPTLTTPLRAVRNAPPASREGRFPVVIYAPGAFNPAWENADLCEYLASYGYVVIATPSVGAKTHTMTFDLAGANAQAGDISFLVGYAQTLPNTDMSRVAVVGMSWGGIANLFAAARDSRIKALVSLDGSMRYFPHVVEEAGDVHPEQMTIPLLAFIQRNFSIEDQNHWISPASREGPSVLNSWTHGDLITVHMMDLAHSEFTSLYQRNEDYWWELFNVWPMWQGDYGRADAITGYGWVARYTRDFLDAYLKHDDAAMAFLKRTPAENHVPSHVMAVNYRSGLGIPITYESFRADVGRRGFDDAPNIYASFRAQDPKFDLDEPMLVDWSDELLADNHLPEALILLKLNLQLHPNSTAAYDKLGNAYELTGQTQMAADDFRDALSKDPLDGEARRKLEELSSHEELARH
jgi:dienelactone hydrolase